MKYSPTCYSKC